MTHQTDDRRNDLWYHNMSVRGNAINFSNTEMHKTAYYNPSQNFPHYFPGENGYGYEPPFGHTAPSPTGGEYYPPGSCAIQNDFVTGGSDYKTPQCNEEYGNYYYQNQNIPPGNSLTNHSSSKSSKIFPWMTESRQNSKQKQNHQQQASQQQPTPSQPAQTQQTTTSNSQTMSGKCFI